jgi:4-amino-4-deoxy-L-arabinose transferase-like glycosyltransferase
MAMAPTGQLRIAATRELAADWRLSAACGLVGVLVAVIFSFLIYPRIAGSANAGLDPDGHGALGWGLYKFHSLSFYPNTEPTLTRGPLYPMAVAAILELTPNAWPFNVQLVQDLWSGITCALVFEIGRRLFGSRTGLIAGMLCAIYPLLVWYTPRIWIETMSILLFTAFVLAGMYFMERPSLGRGAIVGLLIGALCLSKGTFVPFVLVTPLYFFIFRRQAGFLPLAIIPVVAILAVLPWTVRNWMLTGGRFILVHGQAGFNLRIGDLYTAHARETNYNFLPHWERGTAEAAAIFQKARAEGDPGWLAEIKVNDGMLNSSLQSVAAHPSSLVKKMFVNSIGFWMLSETRTKSILSGLSHVPLLAAFAFGMVRLIRGRRITPALAFPLVLIGIYYLSHLPFLGAVRYSAVIVPVMLVYAVGGWIAASPAAMRSGERPA